MNFTPGYTIWQQHRNSIFHDLCIFVSYLCQLQNCPKTGEAGELEAQEAGDEHAREHKNISHPFLIPYPLRTHCFWQGERHLGTIKAGMILYLSSELNIHVITKEICCNEILHYLVVGVVVARICEVMVVPIARADTCNRCC